MNLATSASASGWHSNAEVMRQETDGLWQARQETLPDRGADGADALAFCGPPAGALWENFARLWQDTRPRAAKGPRRAGPG